MSTFGPRVRGISPYSDALVGGLKALQNIETFQLDFDKAFPGFLLPKDTDYSAANDYATIHYLKPWTWRVVREFDCDVIHFQYWSPAFLPMLMILMSLARKSRARIVLTWHNASPHEAFPLLSLFEQRLIRHCDEVICHTKNGKALLTSKYSNVNVTVIPHGCNPIGIEHADEEDYRISGLSDDFEYVLFFGNIRPYKGLDLLLTAWQKLAAKFPNTKLVVAGRMWSNKKSIFSKIVSLFIGTDKMAERLQQQLADLGDDAICDFGFVPDERLVSYLRIARLTVFPYRHFESQSGAAAQAAGRGLPYICTPVGGLQDLAIDQNFVSRSVNASDLADTLEFALCEYETSWKERQLAKAASVSWPIVAAKHQRLYEDVVGRG